MLRGKLVELSDSEYFARKERIGKRLKAHRERIERERAEAERHARERLERKTDYLAYGIDKLAEYMAKK